MKKHLSIFLVIALMGISSAQALTFNVTKPGTLAAAVGASASTMRSITVVGNIDQRDFYFMNNQMPQLTVVNLSKANIMAFDVYAANEMPQYAFIHNSRLTKITMPISLRSIGTYALLNCNGLTTLTLPINLKNIGFGSFMHCSGLTSVIFPESLTVIGNHAFWGCEGLTSVNFPSSLEKIGVKAFQGCIGLSGELYFPASIFSVGDLAFSRANISSLRVASSATVLNRSCFENCKSLSTVSLPRGTTTLPELIFFGCVKLESIILPTTLKSIANNAFNNSGLTSIKIPNSVTDIGNAAFAGTPLVSVTLPNKLTIVNSGLFVNCYNLQTVVFPASVTNINSSLFDNCTTVRSITFNNPNPVGTPDEYTFRGVDRATCLLIVPAGSGQLYRSAPYYSEFLNIIEMSAPLKAGSELTGTFDNVRAINAMVYATSEGIVVDGCKQGDEITVTSINGNLIATLTAYNNFMSIPVNPRGVYIVKVGSTVTKVVK